MRISISRNTTFEGVPLSWLLSSTRYDLFSNTRVEYDKNLIRLLERDYRLTLKRLASVSPSTSSTNLFHVLVILFSFPSAFLLFLFLHLSQGNRTFSKERERENSSSYTVQHLNHMVTEFVNVSRQPSISW